MNKLMMAAVAAMFAVSAHAGEAAKSNMVEVTGVDAKTCTAGEAAKTNKWVNGKCWKSETTAATTAPAAGATKAPAADAAKK